VRAVAQMKRPWRKATGRIDSPNRFARSRRRVSRSLSPSARAARLRPQPVEVVGGAQEVGGAADAPVAGDERRVGMFAREHPQPRAHPGRPRAAPAGVEVRVEAVEEEVAGRDDPVLRQHGVEVAVRMGDAGVAEHDVGRADAKPAAVVADELAR